MSLQGDHLPVCPLQMLHHDTVLQRISDMHQAREIVSGAQVASRAPCMASCSKSSGDWCMPEIFCNTTQSLAERMPRVHKIDMVRWFIAAASHMNPQDIISTCLLLLPEPGELAEVWPLDSGVSCMQWLAVQTVPGANCCHPQHQPLACPASNHLA